MARPRKPEDPQRHKPCDRCGGCYPQARRWPEGRICTYCYLAARVRRGRCATCDHDGILPGLDSQGRPTCRRCSGIQLKVDCLKCGAEDALIRADTCVRCVLRDDLRALLAGADGRVNPVFDPFVELVAGMPKPASGVAWLRVNKINHKGLVHDLLRRLGTGQLALTHEEFDALPSNRSVHHLRGLLVRAGLLPARDELLARYSAWLARKLAAIPDDNQRRIIDQFARWDHLRRLRRHADRDGEVSRGQFLTAKQYTTVAVDFLRWLGERDRTLADCTQADIDSWFATGPTTRQQASHFLFWARRHRLLPKLTIPFKDSTPRLSPFGREQRLACLRELLVNNTMPLPYRVAGGLLLLFGLAAGRIAALRLDQVRTVRDARQGHSTAIRIAEDWIDVPEPLATLLRTHLNNRPNTNTATNHDAHWLFPGYTPGRHLDTGYLVTVLRRHGIPH